MPEPTLASPPMIASFRRPVVLCVATVAASVTISAQRKPAAPTPATTIAIDTASFRALQWRNVGPYRGGRANAASGIATQPLTYFAGYTGGGLWRTDDAGITWRNISDGWFRTGSIGAIAVAPSDANVIYVGTGEEAIRGQSSSYGDGVYRSTDQGRTWTNVGLAATRQIAAVRVHPTDPNVVYVAAQGDRWKSSAERGIYRTRDGGATWQLVLKGVNNFSGASDVSMDATNPRILYASFWDHQRTPWMVRSGGEGSGIWKSVDGGDTWKRLTEGLPALMGKIGVSVSPANPDRVFAIVEAERGGLYRSDDAGRTWALQSSDRLIQTRSWYYMKIFSDPKNADAVWIMNAPVLKSIDGGRTFRVVEATHGDNHHLWINPIDGKSMINSNDGGVSVSLDGGLSWSSQDNQPTAQFYHVTTDHDFPYKLYSGQQDNSSVIIRSRSDDFAIGVRDWWPGPGCESANIGVGPKDSRYVYGGCYQGLIDELDQQTGLSRAIMPWPAMNLTEPSDKTRFRFNWTAPIRVSQHDGAVLYHGGNVLFRSGDRGQTWAPVGGDLTKNDKARQGKGGGPITNEGAGGEVYGTIVVIHESPHDAKVLYVGTDDGLVQRTRDGGTTWTNVTPKGLTDGLTNEIEVSPHDPATVYVAYRTDRVGDPSAHVFKSTDYGATWTRLVNGLREGEPVRVVREDPVRRDLLYAGTETGVYLSFDGGAKWTPFPATLPVVPVTDLEVHDGDLVAATEGRAFWIMDDLTAIRQHQDSLQAKTAFLYAPRAAVLAGGPSVPARGVGRNPVPGASIFYRLASAPDSTVGVSFDVLDARGTVLRSFSTKDSVIAARLKPKAGLNLLNWDLRRTSPTRLAGVLLFGAPGSGGAIVSPGTYSVRMTMGSTVQTQSLTVLQDPRLAVPATVVAERDSVSTLIADRIREIHDAVLRLRDTKGQVQGALTRGRDATNAAAITMAGKSLVTHLDTMDPRLTTKASNGQDIINYANGINGQYGFLMGQVEGNPVLTKAARERLAELEAQWATIRSEVDTIEQVEIPAFNKLLQDGNVQGVSVRKVVKTTPPIS
ncbi:MAG: glycosyl hydrolase [Gemmatimonadaceae bacterium]|nr:glycosyl hydrolase [Gemmatimonadaceae bacterium]